MLGLTSKKVLLYFFVRFEEIHAPLPASIWPGASLYYLPRTTGLFKQALIRKRPEFAITNDVVFYRDNAKQELC